MSYPVNPELGWYYVVNVAGEVGGVYYEVGDWIVWNGTTWDKLVGKSDVMPIGAIIMYDGAGIANVATRVVELGDEGGDTFAMPGWFVCNGLAGTPDLEKMFVRGGLASGVVEGSDDAIVVSHTHRLRGLMTAETTSGVYLKIRYNYEFGAQQGYIETTGVSGVGKNVPVHYVVIYIKKMS